MRRSRSPRLSIGTGRLPTAIPGGRGFRRRWPVMAILALSALFLAVAAVFPARGAEFVSGDDARVAASRTVDDDLYMTGADAVIAGTVTGDAIVLSQDLIVDGTVERSLMAAGESIVVTGSVGHAARLAGREIRISGRIEGDVLAAGSEVMIEDGATVTGDLIVSAGTLTVRGSVGGDVRGNANEALLDGEIGGDTDINAADLTLGPGARLARDLRYTSPDEADVDPLAIVTGATERDEPVAGASRVASVSISSQGWQWVRLVAALFSGLVLVLLLPRAVRGAAESVRRRLGPSLLLGIGMIIVIPVVSIILMITLIGLPIGLILLFVYFSILFLSEIFVGTAIGRFILPDSWGDQGRGYNVLAMAIGVVILGALRFLPLPGIGFLIAALTAVIGLGAVLLAVRRRTGMSLAPTATPYSGPGPGYY